MGPEVSLFARLKAKLGVSKWYMPGHIGLSCKRLVSLVFLRVKRLIGLDYSFNAPNESNEAIDIFMPTVEKDAEMLDLSIKYAKKNIKHPIGTIYVVAPKSAKKVREVAKQNDCDYVDETTILPITKESIAYWHNGENRNGWIYKMLINLCADQVSSAENILVLDSDTVFIRPQVFIYKGRPLFNVSNEYHLPYYRANTKLLGLRHNGSRSYITHYMMFNRETLQQLRSDIERRWGGKWYEAIISQLDRSEGSAFADYELYADYYIKSNMPKPIINYWSNISMEVDSIGQVEALIKDKAHRFASLSLHNYKRNDS